MFRTNLFRCSLIVLTALTCYRADAQHHAPGYWQPPGIHVPRSQYQAPIVDYYGGQKPQLWDPNQPIERLVGEVAQRSWIRVDYLHWDFEGITGRNIGAPVANFDTLNPLIVFDNLNGGVTTGVGVIPTTTGLGQDDASGIRGTWGIDLRGADLELEFFGTGERENSQSVSNIQSFRATGFESIGTTQRPNVVVPLLSSGVPADAATANYLIFDSSFRTELTSQMWGAEATILTEPYVPGEGAAWQWLGGFRYLNYDETYGMRGVFNDGGRAADTVTQFTSSAVNNIYGPEAGFRASLRHRWFTLSATPRVALALNDYSAKTNVTSIAGNTSPTGGDDSDVDFTALVQVSFLGELHLTDHCSFFAGYDMMWIPRMVRPFDNIVYNSTPGAAGAPVPDILQAVNPESFTTHGMSFGFVFRY